MKLLLDTCAYSEFKRGGENVSYLMRRAERIYLSAIVAGELLYGFRRGKRLRENLREMDAFLDNPYVRFLPVTRDTADRFSRIMVNPRKKGKPIPTNDVWIAAQAMEKGAELISLDDHFEHIDGLVWAQV